MLFVYQLKRSKLSFMKKSLDRAANCDFKVVAKRNFIYNFVFFKQLNAGVKLKETCYY